MTDARPVFNIVVTGHTFWHLRFFVCSLVHNSDAQFRLVANYCEPEALALMETYAAAHPDQVVEVMDVSPAEMLAHGVAMDRVRGSRDDGELFCFVDPDIKATGSFLRPFLELLRTQPPAQLRGLVDHRLEAQPHQLVGRDQAGDAGTDDGDLRTVPLGRDRAEPRRMPDPVVEREREIRPEDGDGPLYGTRGRTVVGRHGRLP